MPAYRTHVAPHASWHFFETLFLWHLFLETLRSHLRSLYWLVHGTTWTPGANGGYTGAGGFMGGFGGLPGGEGGFDGFGIFGGRDGFGGLPGGAGDEGGSGGGDMPFVQTW